MEIFSASLPIFASLRDLLSNFLNPLELLLNLQYLNSFMNLIELFLTSQYWLT